MIQIKVMTVVISEFSAKCAGLCSLDGEHSTVAMVFMVIRQWRIMMTIIIILI